MKDMLLGFAGDVVVDREYPDEVFAKVETLIRKPDITFANLESPYTDTPGVAVTAGIVIAPPLHNLDVFARTGFDVLSLANNHIVDAGHAPFLDTRARLHAQGIATCGAGANLAEARRPAILRRSGMSVGFLGYASIFPHGYEARSTVPGLAPLRAYNHYHEGLPACYGPGYLPRLETIPDPQDHRNLEQDIEAIRGEVDLLAVSFHWGDHMRPFILTDHERRTARLCIDRGADLVLGHHHHTLRGVEWYRGKPIFYGLGHLVFDHRVVLTEELQRYFDSVDPDSYAVCPREGWPLLPLHPDTRMTMFAWAQVSGGKITDIGFVPCRLYPDGVVAPVDPESPDGVEVVKYLERCNRSEKLNGKLLLENAPVIAGHRSMRVVPTM